MVEVKSLEDCLKFGYILSPTTKYDASKEYEKKMKLKEKRWDAALQNLNHGLYDIAIEAAFSSLETEIDAILVQNGYIIKNRICRWYAIEAVFGVKLRKTLENIYKTRIKDWYDWQSEDVLKKDAKDVIFVKIPKLFEEIEKYSS